VLGAAFVFCHLAFVFLTCYIYISVWMCFVTELLITRDGFIRLNVKIMQLLWFYAELKIYLLI